MIYKLSKSSLQRLSQCHVDLHVLMQEAIKNSPYDFGISHGNRTPKEQNDLFQKGRENGVIVDKSKVVTYLDGYNKKSKHNYLPSLAVDIKCYVNGQITWNHGVFIETGTHIMEVAEVLFDNDRIKSQISWGGNWHKFKDLPHFQI